jgi:hypothetical protein
VIRTADNRIVQLREVCLQQASWIGQLWTKKPRRLGLVVSTTHMLLEPIRLHGQYRGPSDYVRSAYEVAQRREAQLRFGVPVSSDLS